MTEHQTFQSTDGLILAYRDHGAGSGDPAPLVCLPGMTRNGRDFAAFAASLRGRRVICLDFRGRGRSAHAPDPMSYRGSVYVRDVIALLDAAGVGRAVLVGASMGGAVAMRVAATLGDRIAGLILDDVGPDVSAADPARIAAFLRSPLIARSWAEAADRTRTVQAANFPLYTAADWDAAARRLCREQPDGVIRADYDPALAAPYETPGGVEDWDRWAVFGSLGAVPTLVVRGALSTILTTDTVAAMRAVAPRLKAVDVPDVGHHPDLTEPAAAEAIAAFLGSLA